MIDLRFFELRNLSMVFLFKVNFAFLLREKPQFCGNGEVAS